MSTRALVAGVVCIAFAVGLLYGRGLAPSAVVAPRPVVPVIPSTPLAPADRMASFEEFVSSKSTAASNHPDDVQDTPPVDEDAPFVLLGVITNPSGFKRRQMLREFASLSGGADGGVRTEYVIGDGYVGQAPSPEIEQQVAAEVAEHGDIVIVEGREALPNVGKATEKSAAWWLTAPLRSGASVFCKTDDDSLIHLGHLSASIEAAVRSLPGKHLLYSFVRWRGWLPFHRMQACGGGWGGPADAINQMEDVKNHCELAEGPFPQGTGTLTCMSAALARALAQERDFDTFLRVSKARNDFGTPCRSAKECASHSHGMHMWHHEDAGISYNLWRAVIHRGLNLSIVHLPEKGWIWPWFNSKIQDPAASAKAIVMHKVTPSTFKQVVRQWNVSEPAPPIEVDCSQTCTQWGWKYARYPCEPPSQFPAGATWRGFHSTWNGTFCRIQPAQRFDCCFLKSVGRYAFNMTRNRELDLKLNGRACYGRSCRQVHRLRPRKIDHG
jgi:hypothetical protein